MSKSRKIGRMLAEQDEQRPAGQRRRGHGSSEGNVEEHAAAETEIEDAEEEDGDEEQQHIRMHDGKSYRITFPDFPGGPGTFEAATKFCYGVRVELTPWNVAPLRCAAEYLEMTEEHSEDNLAARAEAYLSQSVLRHPGEATKALKSCEELLPHAEELGIVARCVDAIAARSSATSRSWFGDLAVLGLHMYKRVMAAMAARKDVRTEALEGCLVSYAKSTLPGLSRSMRWRRASAPVSSEVEQRDLLEAVVASLPADKGSGSVVTAKFLFALLRTAHILRAWRSSGRPRRIWNRQRWRTCSSRATPAPRRRSTTWTTSSGWSGTSRPRRRWARTRRRRQLQSLRRKRWRGRRRRVRRPWQWCRWASWWTTTWQR
uniref:NPH3 domain-containing protein n=1 Tax=Triticum urartu TaxID=4572 RepID=A0A8R7U3W3_TRIUA